MITHIDDPLVQEGCGSAQCGCKSAAPAVPQRLPAINGVSLLCPGEALEQLDPAVLHERASTELLRQEAVRLGHLPARAVKVAPELDEAQRQAIEALLDQAITVPTPDAAACERHYAARKAHFVVDQALHVRHILFAVTPGVNVHALSQRAEAALLELSRKDVPAGRFEALARELSNCPSSAEGGELGWVTPEDCAPELANELFFQSESGWGMGVHPRLVHTRFGFHIVEVLGRRKGRQLGFDEVRERVTLQLSLRAQSTALRQYLAVLAGQAEVVGVDLERADTPLVQ